MPVRVRRAVAPAQDQAGRLRSIALRSCREPLAVNAGLANELLDQVGCAHHLESEARLEQPGKWLHSLVFDIETAHDRECAIRLSRHGREQDV